LSRRILIVALAGAIGLSACGGSSNKQSGAVETTTTTAEPTTTTTLAPVTKAAYVQQANAICQVMNDKTKALGDPGDDLAAVIVLFEKGKQITADALAGLRALRMPTGDDAILNGIWAKVDTLIADIDQAILAVRAGDQKKFMAVIDQLDQHEKAANSASTAYGLNVCAEES
jgi:hypothetical protein